MRSSKIRIVEIGSFAARRKPTCTQPRQVWPLTRIRRKTSDPVLPGYVRLWEIRFSGLPRSEVLAKNRLLGYSTVLSAGRNYQFPAVIIVGRFAGQRSQVSREIEDHRANNEAPTLFVLKEEDELPRSESPFVLESSTPDFPRPKPPSRKRTVRVAPVQACCYGAGSLNPPCGSPPRCPRYSGGLPRFQSRWGLIAKTSAAGQLTQVCALLPCTPRPRQGQLLAIHSNTV